MTLTIHGWEAIPSASDPRLKSFLVPGTVRKLLLRKDIGPYLVAFAAEYSAVIAKIDVGTYDDWAWCPPRAGRASATMSDHCAGVAIDLDATKEGSQGSASLKFWANPVKAMQLRTLRKKYKLLEWGGDYSAKNRDPMHWTFNYGIKEAAIRAEMKRLGINANGVIK